MPEVTEWDPEDPEKIYNDLMQRCKQTKQWMVRCIVDESWTGFQGPAPFGLVISDGMFTCKVLATSFDEAKLQVVNKLPVLKFLDDKHE